MKLEDYEYYRTDLGVLYCGDCLQVMPLLEPESVDLVLTDPPYNIGKKYGCYRDKVPEKEYWMWIHSIFKETFRIMKDGYLLVSHLDRGVFGLKAVLEPIGYNFLQFIVWYGPNGFATVGQRKTIPQRHELILSFEKGAAPVLPDPRGTKAVWYNSVITVPRPQSNYRDGRCHPTQKPLKLYKILLSRYPASAVLDPFVGSGTTAISAEQLGIPWIAVEIDSEYCEIAKKRIDAEARQMKLPFASRTRVDRMCSF